MVLELSEDSIFLVITEGFVEDLRGGSSDTSAGSDDLSRSSFCV